MSTMGFSISLMTAQRAFAVNSARMTDSLIKLATGLAINRAADDPSGLIASEDLQATLKMLDAESRAMRRTDVHASVAEAALSEVSGLLIEAEALAVSSANTGGMSDEEIAANQMQLDSIMQSIQRISSTTQFAGRPLLDGSARLVAGDARMAIESVALIALGNTQVQLDEDNTTTANLSDLAAGGLLNLASGRGEDIQKVIAAARSAVATQRGKIGAFQTNTIAPMLRTNRVAFNNMSAALSEIRDTDFAAETAKMMRYSILSATSQFAISSSLDSYRERTLSLLA